MSVPPDPLRAWQVSARTCLVVSMIHRDERVWAGTGFLVGGGRVLTAGHSVVNSRVGVLIPDYVRFWDREEDRHDTVPILRVLHYEPDLAWVELDGESLPDRLKDVPAPPFGEIDRDESRALSVQVTGYPRFRHVTDADGGVRDPKSLALFHRDGEIWPGNFRDEGARHLLAVHMPYWPDDWQGISGAPVWSRHPPSIVGVVIEHPRQSDGGELVMQSPLICYEGEKAVGAELLLELGLPASRDGFEEVLPDAVAEALAAEAASPRDVEPVSTPLAGYNVPRRWRAGGTEPVCGAHGRRRLDIGWVPNRRFFAGVVADRPEADLAWDLNRAEEILADLDDVRSRRWETVDTGAHPEPSMFTGPATETARGFVIRTVGARPDRPGDWIGHLRAKHPDSPVVFQVVAGTAARATGLALEVADLLPRRLEGEPVHVVTRFRPGTPAFRREPGGGPVDGRPLLPRLARHLVAVSRGGVTIAGLGVATAAGEALADEDPDEVAAVVYEELSLGAVCDVPALLSATRDLVPDLYAALVTVLARSQAPARLRQESLVVAALAEEDLGRWLGSAGAGTLPAPGSLPSLPGLGHLVADSVLCALLRGGRALDARLRPWCDAASPAVARLAEAWAAGARDDPRRLLSLDDPRAVWMWPMLWDDPPIVLERLTVADWKRPQLWAYLSAVPLERSVVEAVRAQEGRDAEDVRGALGLLAPPDDPVRRDTIEQRRWFLHRGPAEN